LTYPSITSFYQELKPFSKAIKAQLVLPVDMPANSVDFISTHSNSD